VEVFRTPDERFAGLPGYPFAPHYVEVDGLRMHYVDEGPADADPVLLLHGEPSWSYLYRKMVPVLTAAGHRAVAPDLIGFGRSDKPTDPAAHTYSRHVRWMAGFMEALDLRRVTLFCQDWGGLIGLRLVAEHGDRFSRVVASNTGLPIGDEPFNPAFRLWQLVSTVSPVFPVGRVIQLGTTSRLPSAVRAAYDAPFPNRRSKAAARRLPRLVPTSPDDPETANNRRAWEALGRWEKPFLTAFGDSDPVTRGADRAFHARVPGARGQPHATIPGAGHFIQEDKGPELARLIIDFISGRAPAPRPDSQGGHPSV
jgi:haloalkane dehalogenase